MAGPSSAPDGAVTCFTPAGEDNLTVRAEQLSITATGWSAVQAADELPDRSPAARPRRCPARVVPGQR
ncbi:MAG: hypothetical protein R2749_03570 [Acidimicrobiales bacterium]